MQEIEIPPELSGGISQVHLITPTPSHQRPPGGTHDTGPINLRDSPDRSQLIWSAAGSTAGERKIMNKVPKAGHRDRTSPQNGMPEPVRYVYRQQERRNDWAARIARRNAQGWWQPPAALPVRPKAYAHRPDLRVIPLTIPVI